MKVLYSNLLFTKHDPIPLLISIKDFFEYYIFFLHDIFWFFQLSPLIDSKIVQQDLDEVWAVKPNAALVVKDFVENKEENH